MKIITGNNLETGDVVWWTGNGWSRHISDAVDVPIFMQDFATAPVPPALPAM